MARIFLGFGLLVPCGLFGQVPVSPQAVPTAFTVASIKPNKSADNRFMLRPLPGAGLTATGVTLNMLVGFAYGVATYQISGGPSWMSTERWDIEAKTDGFQGSLPRDQFTVLLRGLIEDRFRLKTRRKTKKLPVYALVVAKSGPKLKPHSGETDKSKPLVQFGNGSATFSDSSVAGLAGQLTLNLGRPVMDRTGIQGSYDFHFELDARAQ